MNYIDQIKRDLLILIGLFMLCVPKAQTQNWNILYKYFNDNEKTVVDKAIKSINEAGEITQEANAYYSEALKLQSINDSSKQTDQKEQSKLESKAVTQQISGDKLYSNAYKALYELCIVHLNTLGSQDTGSTNYIEKAREMMNQADTKRKEATDIDNPYDKATRLNDATGFENAGIDDMIVAISIAHGDSSSKSLSAGGQVEDAEVQNKILLSVEKTLNAKDTNSKSEKITVDQDLIQKYGNYVNDMSIPDPMVVNRAGASGMNGFDADQAKNLYQNYETGTKSPGKDQNNSEIPAENVDSKADATKLVSDKAGNSSNQSINTNTAHSANPDVVNSNDVYDISTPQQNQEVRFMVQIAASRIPLTRAQLWAIYPGNLSVEVIRDANWFKYRITGFRFFSDASMVATESGAKNAWVLSASLGKEINLEKAKDMTRILEAGSKQYKYITGDIDFFVQVAASRVGLTDEEISNLCHSTNACREIIENGWFKYQVFTGTNYKEAIRLRKSMSIKSFVVAYKDGTKINLYQAIHRVGNSK
jgi:hypothetical protein